MHAAHKQPLEHHTVEFAVRAASKKTVNLRGRKTHSPYSTCDKDSGMKLIKIKHNY